MLIKYVERLTRHLKQKNDQVLSEPFSIIFDGWTANSVHYVSGFAAFENSSDNGYVNSLLAVFIMVDKTSQSAQEHYKFQKFVLSVYNRRPSSIVALAIDNAYINRAITRTADFIFVGCMSH